MHTGVSLLNRLPPAPRAELAEARRRNLADADLDATTLVPAFDRYDGSLYQRLESVRDTLGVTPAMIISGGYGGVQASRPR